MEFDDVEVLMCHDSAVVHDRAAGAPEKENVSPVIPEITMAMLRAGEEALRAFDPEKEEDAALVAAIYWAMDAARVNCAPRK